MKAAPRRPPRGLGGWSVVRQKLAGVTSFLGMILVADLSSRLLEGSINNHAIWTLGKDPQWKYIRSPNNLLVGFPLCQSIPSAYLRPIAVELHARVPGQHDVIQGLTMV